MKKFVWGIILDEGEYLTLEPDANYGDLAFGDYIVHGLFDITDSEKPKTLYLDDNTHTNIEASIEAFFEGLDYCGLPYELSTENVFWTKDSSYETDYTKLNLCVKGSSTVYNNEDNNSILLERTVNLYVMG